MIRMQYTNLNPLELEIAFVPLPPPEMAFVANCTNVAECVAKSLQQWLPRYLPGVLLSLRAPRLAFFSSSRIWRQPCRPHRKLLPDKECLRVSSVLDLAESPHNTFSVCVCSRELPSCKRNFRRATFLCHIIYSLPKLTGKFESTFRGIPRLSGLFPIPQVSWADDVMSNSSDLDNWVNVTHSSYWLLSWPLFHSRANWLNHVGLAACH